MIRNRSWFLLACCLALLACKSAPKKHGHGRGGGGGGGMPAIPPPLVEQHENNTADAGGSSSHDMQPGESTVDFIVVPGDAPIPSSPPPAVAVQNAPANAQMNATERNSTTLATNTATTTAAAHDPALSPARPLQKTNDVPDATPQQAARIVPQRDNEHSTASLPPTTDRIVAAPVDPRPATIAPSIASHPGPGLQVATVRTISTNAVGRAVPLRIPESPVAANVSSATSPRLPEWTNAATDTKAGALPLKLWSGAESAAKPSDPSNRTLHIAGALPPRSTEPAASPTVLSFAGPRGTNYAAVYPTAPPFLVSPLLNDDGTGVNWVAQQRAKQAVQQKEREDEWTRLKRILHRWLAPDAERTE